jgi:hypothetical protein
MYPQHDNNKKKLYTHTKRECKKCIFYIFTRVGKKDSFVSNNNKNSMVLAQKQT